LGIIGRVCGILPTWREVPNDRILDILNKVDAGKEDPKPDIFMDVSQR
jgi:hypothetical protein